VAPDGPLVLMPTLTVVTMNVKYFDENHENGPNSRNFSAEMAEQGRLQSIRG
jgi:hypothetical protein